MVGTTISGNCSFGILLNLTNPYADMRIATMYIAVLLSIAQLVGLNCLNFFDIPSKSFMCLFFHLILVTWSRFRRDSSLAGMIARKFYGSFHIILFEAVNYILVVVVTVCP